MKTIEMTSGLEKINTNSYMEVNDFMLDRALEIGKSLGYDPRTEKGSDKIYFEVFNQVDAAVSKKLFNGGGNKSTFHYFLDKLFLRVKKVTTTTETTKADNTGPWATSGTTEYLITFEAEVEDFLNEDDFEIISLAEKDFFTYLQSKNPELSPKSRQLVSEKVYAIKFDYEQMRLKNKITGTVKKSTTLYYN